MFHILGFIFLFIIAILIIGLSIIGNVIKLLFGRGGSRSTTTSNADQSGKVNQPKQHKKVFTQDDGEYVDYEEV